MKQIANPEQLLQQALSLHRADRPEKAVPLYRRLLAEFPGNARLLFLLGSAETQRGNPAAGVRLLEEVLAAQPFNVDALNNLGLALQRLARVDEALQAFDRAIALQASQPGLHINKGLALRDLGRYHDALASFDRALEIDPGNAEQHNNRGNVLLDLGRGQEALASFDRSIAIAPAYAEAHVNRGTALQQLGHMTAALESVDRGIGLNAELAEAHNLRGDLLLFMRREAEARASFQKAHSLAPQLEFVVPRLLFSRLRTCDWTGIASELAKLATAIGRGEQRCVPFDGLALTGSPGLQRTIAEAYTARKFASHSSLGPIPARPAGARIRLGYYSSEFRDHATMQLMAELFELHDRSRFEVLAFDFGPAADDPMQRRVAGAVDRVVDVRAMSDRDIAGLSRELEIDIAVDLKGYTEHARPGIFAERAAPIQVSYLGYPGTMGAGFIDYLIADAVLVPASSRKHYTERIATLPDSYQVNDRRRVIAQTAMRREELGLPPDAFVFCCFNNNYKITPPVFDTWMRVLTRVKDSVLWLIEDNAAAAANLRKEASKRGVQAERLCFARRIPLPEHLARHRAADLFLDTLPYNAHTTASDALWAGLPVLTCAGEAFASRVAASLLNAVGLPELVTTSPAQYEALAVELASDSRPLSLLRQRLAARASMPLFDTPRFARHLEVAYVAMHDRHHAGLAPDDIAVTPP
jgi:predicted O-linked N-acetylglucosamine transferase (SPINDLY family)